MYSLKGVGESIDLSPSIIERKGRPRSRRQTEPFHEWHRAVMACSDRNALQIRNRPDVMRMSRIHDKRDDADLVRSRPDHR